MNLDSLPHLNACLNTISACLLAMGYVAIRRKNVVTHARFMVAACVVSAAFLVSYITYHYGAGHKVYPGTGGLRVFYLAVLFSHIVLAVVTLPLVLTTLTLAAKRRWDLHRKLARWTFPIWIYVSVTGVVVYVMLYQMS